jgi:non-ribosomal peptide synthetase component F
MFGIIPADARPGLLAMKLDNWLAQRAETCPDRVAVVADGVELTYEELEAEATGAARHGGSAAGRASPSRDRPASNTSCQSMR